MKRTLTTLILGLFCLTSLVLANPNQPGKKSMTDEEIIAERNKVKDAAYILLDQMVGRYEATLDIDGEKHVAQLTINPKFVNDLYYPGYYKLKNSEGKVIYESALMFTYNSGGMNYFFFFFDSDGFIKTTLGRYTEGFIRLNSQTRTGLEYHQYTKIDENTLKYEFWEASREPGHPDDSPDQIITYTKLK